LLKLSDSSEMGSTITAMTRLLERLQPRPAEDNHAESYELSELDADGRAIDSAALGVEKSLITILSLTCSLHD
jgi:hypothetical protein